jgi:hypothetical protein
MIRLYLAVLSGLILSLPLAGESGFRGQCAGGTLEGISKSLAKLHIAGVEEFVFSCGKAEFRVPYGRINTVEYGQRVSRRYAAAVLISPVLLLSKERRHFVTLGFTDGNGVQQAVVFRVEKADIRSVLAGLEARTGRRVEFQDDEARKGGN